MKLNLEVKDLTIVGDVFYEHAPDGHNKGFLSVVDHQYTALLFPVSKRCVRALQVNEDDRDPHEEKLLLDHLKAPLRDHVDSPLLRVISESFEDPDVLDWEVTVGYTSGKDNTPYRVYMFKPPEKNPSGREPYEYVSHLLTTTREKGPVFRLKFGHGTADEEED